MKDQNLINENELYLVDGSEIDKYTFTATAGQNTFTIPFEFDGSSSLTLYYNGVMMKENDNYTIAGNVITLVDWTAEEGDYITVMGIQGAAAIDFAKDADKYMKQMEDKAVEVKADLTSTATTAKNDITSTASTSKTEINAIISTGKNDLNNLISTLPDNWNNVMDKNSANVMGANGKITMNSSYVPSGDNDLVTMKYVSENSYKIGDTLTTARTDLGDDWLLCNGDTLNSSDYSVLSQYFTPVSTMALDYDENTITSVSSKRDYQFAIHVNENDSLDMCMMYDQYSSSSHQALYYKNQNDTSWTLMTTGDDFSLKTLNNKIFIINGGTSSPSIKYCDTSFTSLNDFISLQLPALRTGVAIGESVYLNGKYYFCLYNKSGNYYSGVLVYDNLSSSPQLITAPDKLGTSTFNDIGIVNGQIILCVRQRGGSENNPTANLIYWTVENGVGVKFSIQPFEKKWQSTDSGVSRGAMWSFKNKYILPIRNMASSSSHSINLCEITDLTNGITSEITSISWNPKNTFNYANSFYVSNDIILCSNKTYIDSNLQVHNWDNASSISQTQCGRFIETDSYFYTMCPQFKILRLSKSPQFNLPVYSEPTGLYTYIKAK